MSRNRGKRRGPARDQGRSSAPSGAPSSDRYDKFLPEWMRGNNAATLPPRPARPRRARPPRPAGGYTPGKFALGDR